MIDTAGEPVDADAVVVAGDAPPSRRVPLDRDRILAAAVAFIDEQSLRDLTMRRLGAALGVEAMSLYRYVPGREELLDGVVELILTEMQADPDVLEQPAGRVAGLPATDGARGAPGGADPPRRVPAGGVPAARGAVAAAAAAQPAVGRALPRGAGGGGLLRRGGGRRLPRVHQLPAGSPAARGVRARSRHRAAGHPRGRRGAHRVCTCTRRSPGCARRCPRTTPPASSRSRWRACWTGSR